MNAPRLQSGFALVNAIFLIVVLGGLAAVAATLARSSADTSTRSLQSARVYYGAKAGLDWGIHRAIAAGEAACAASTTFALAQGALAGINVTVTCDPDRQGSAANVVYYITSCATTGTSCAAPGSLGGPGYAERRLEATVSTIP